MSRVLVCRLPWVSFLVHSLQFTVNHSSTFNESLSLALELVLISPSHYNRYRHSPCTFVPVLPSSCCLLIFQCMVCQRNMSGFRYNNQGLRSTIILTVSQLNHCYCNRRILMILWPSPVIELGLEGSVGRQDMPLIVRCFLAFEHAL